MPIRWLALAVGLASLTTQSLASTRVAVYAIVDSIEFEPSSFEPERAWISGVFVVPVPISSGLHAKPARGHLYLRLDAANAGYRVGYNDAAHFNREYKKLFGVPPMRDCVCSYWNCRETPVS